MMPKLLLIGGDGKWGQVYQQTLIDLDIPYTVANKNNYKSLIKSNDHQGAIISTPAYTHIQIAEDCLQYSLPVLIEKPLSLSINDIFPLYVHQDFPILINHIQLFNSALMQVILQTEGKTIIEMNSYGFGFGPWRADCPPILDYCHDFSISLHLSKQFPTIHSVEEINTSSGKIYFIVLDYPTFKHSMVIGNGSEISARFLEIKYNDGTIYHIDALSQYSLYINGQPYTQLNSNTSMENLLINFTHGIKYGVKDERWGLDLGKKVVKLAGDCEKFLLNSNPNKQN